jgi:glycosyltransferase involved in cell wall biosynthesis
MSAAAPHQERVEGLVSIVVPTRNRVKMLADAIDSCLNQSYKNLEVIVVDGGSDGTQEYVATVTARDPRVSYCREQGYRLPGAINTGHRAARGEYATWTSDDTRYDRDAIELMIGCLNEDPSIAVAYCNARLYDGKGKFIRIHNYPGPEHLWDGCTIGQCNLYLRSAFDEVGEYDEDLFLAEDYDFWLRMSKRHRIVQIGDAPHYTVIRHAASLSDVYRPEVDVQAARARAKNCDRRSVKLRYLADGHIDAAYTYRERGLPRKAVRHALLGVRYWPGDFRAYRCLGGIVRDWVLRSAGPTPPADVCGEGI